MKIILATAALAALAGLAAAETYDVSGTGRAEVDNEPMPVAEGLVAIRTNANYTGFESESSDNPLAGASGPCWGSVLIDKGAASGGGLCSYTDAGGDGMVIRWTVERMTEDERNQGNWELIGGSGKWDGASGGGTFDAGTDAEGVYGNNVTGEVTLP